MYPIQDDMRRRDWEKEHACIELWVMDVVSCGVLVVLLRVLFLEFRDD